MDMAPVINLFGTTNAPSLALPDALTVIRIVLRPSDMTVPGWLQRLCAARLRELGDVTLLLMDPAGMAIGLVQSVAAAMATAEAEPITAPAYMPLGERDLFA